LVDKRNLLRRRNREGARKEEREEIASTVRRKRLRHRNAERRGTTGCGPIALLPAHTKEVKQSLFADGSQGAP
jgi:hypothetical protein